MRNCLGDCANTDSVLHNFFIADYLERDKLRAGIGQG
jgi:hypothetical protein